MPGVSFGVLVDAELIFADGLGTLDIRSDCRPSADSVFRIASMTKSFTAAAVLKLRDTGKLSLDDPIASYVPQLAQLSYPAADSVPITVRDLLSMSAGWPQDDPWADRQLHRNDAWMAALYSEGVSFSNPPGVRFEYCNYGYILLGSIVSTVSGRSAMEFITQTLLKPLEMNSTVWGRDQVNTADIAQGYRWEDDVWREEQPLSNGGDVAAFAGLYSSVRDLSRWIGMFQSAWPAREATQAEPLSRASLREMQRIWQCYTPSLETQRVGTSPELFTGGYGYGLSMSHNGAFRTAGHGGGLPGFGSHMRWAPDHGVGVVALANVTYANVHDACDEVLDVLIRGAGIEPRKTASSQALTLAHDQICRLMNTWDEELANDVFADNFFLDSDEPHWRQRFDELRAVHGSFVASADVDAENWLRGKRRLGAEHGWCEVWLSLAPTVPPRVQALKLRSVLPPAPALSEAAARLADLTAKPRRAQLDRLLARGIDRDDVWTQLRLVNLSFGSCRVETVSGGDGSSWATFELTSKTHKLTLNLRVNAKGKLTEVTLAPML